jgi:hypothetical protein
VEEVVEGATKPKTARPALVVPRMRGRTLRAGFTLRWFFDLEGFLKRARLESMKTTIDIPENALADAMRFTGAKTKRDAVVMAIEDFNRRRKVADFLKLGGSFPDFPTNDEIEAADLERHVRLNAKRKRAR